MFNEKFVLNKLSLEYPKLFSAVTRFGAPVQSRLSETREIVNLTLVLNQPTFCVIGRDHFSSEFMHEEIRQLLSGVYDGERLKSILPRAANLITAQTAYGPRVQPQLEFVERELRESPMSRRAVVYVGDKTDALYKDDESTAGEMPCTCVLQFFVRGELLHMTTVMRSWDLVWGLSYDVPSFVAIQMAVARALHLDLGYYVHHAGSAHVYDRHFDLKVWPNTDGELDLPWLRPTIADTRAVAIELAGRRSA